MKIRIAALSFLLLLSQISFVSAQIDYGHRPAPSQLTPMEQLQFQQSLIEKKIDQVQNQQASLDEKIAQTRLQINIIIGSLIALAISIAFIFVKIRSKSKIIPSSNS